MFIARRLRGQIGDRTMVGLLLPPSVGGALTNYALMLMGRVPVNLNYTSSNAVIAGCAAQCGHRCGDHLEGVSGTFSEYGDSRPDDVAGGCAGRAAAERKADGDGDGVVDAGRRLLKRMLGAQRVKPIADDVAPDEEPTRARMDQLATVIFSSGSTGDPKGVMLTHFNIMANIRQVSQVFMLDGRDKILGILPFFHSFGFTAGLWLPAVQGVGVVFHPNPLDAQVIGGLVEKYKVTFMVATPTFLQGYMRRCSPESFGSLEYVLVGAEKLPERVRAGL